MLKPLPLLLLIISLSITTAHIQSTYPNCTGSPSSQPILKIAADEVNSVPNGKKYIIQSSKNSTHLTILTLKGSSYEMGYAYGQLMSQEINQAMTGMFNYLVNSSATWLGYVKQNLPFYLKWIPNLLELDVPDMLTALLRLQYLFTKPYTPQRFTDELQGMAEGANFDLELLTNINLFPEFIRAQCSIVGAWGTASINGGLVQLRALDWDYKSYIANFPVAAIYFSDEEGSNPFATFGFAGMVGAISGYSSEIAISQKVWLPISTDPMSEFGEPFAYLLKDVLQFGNDLDSAMSIIGDAKRTCRNHVGVGARKDGKMEGVMMSFNELYIFDDKNYTYYSDAHPQMDGIFYWDKTIQPSDDWCLGSILKENLGKIDADFLVRYAAPIHETGDTQLIGYDFENGLVYIAYSDPIADVKAYLRPLIYLDMKIWLNEKNFF